MAKTEPIIRVDGLKATYGERTVLRDVSFEVHAGEVFVILGGSGCGKSTLLKHMIGLYRPAHGHIWLEGRELVTATEDERRAILRRIGVMYQSGALFGSMNLIENVCLPLEELTDLPEEARLAIARSKLALVDLAGFEHHMPSEISGGMKKRAAIARAMALDPPILFLDEPSAGLDPITSAGLDRTIVELSRTLGITFVIVTHELDSIFAIADRVIMLSAEEKTILDSGRPRDLRDGSAHEFVRQFFNREPDSPSVAGRPTP